MTSRDTLVCVPGLGLDERAWQPTLRELPGRRAVAVLPGLGRRPDEGDDLRPAELAARLLAALPMGPLVLAGHSASCQVVAHAAAQDPDRIRSLVLVGPTTDPRAGRWPGIVQRWLRTAVHERPDQVPLLVKAYSRTGPGWMLRTMDTVRRDDLRTTLARVTCPVLVVRGRHDRICPEDWAGELSAAAVTLTAGAHMVPLTHGALVAAAVRPALGG